MLPELQHYPVNWVDGMKISKRHLLDTDNYIADHLRDAVAIGLTSYNYGLLPADPSLGRSLELYINCDYTQQINVKLIHCRAITANGNRIEVSQSEKHTLNTSYTQLVSDFNLQPLKEQLFYVVLSVNPFQRVPAGEPLLDETPPRHPYAIPDVRLSIIPAGHVAGEQFSATHLIVGKIIYSAGELKHIRNYIPACTSVSSFEGMVEWFNHFAAILTDIETNALRITQKIKLRNQRSSLTDSVSFVTEKILFALASGHMYFKWIVPQQPPILMMEYLVSLVKHLRVAINFQTDKDKEELLSYFAEWSGLAPGNLEIKLDALINLQYNHLETAQLIAEIDDFYKSFSDLLVKLSQLEFIGKRKGQQNVFIAENTVNDTPPPPPEKKSRWSPI
jgi:hypothetical protein